MNKILISMLSLVLISCSTDTRETKTPKKQTIKYYDTGGIESIRCINTNTKFYEIVGFDSLGFISYQETGRYTGSNYTQDDYQYKERTWYGNEKKPYYYAFGTDSNDRYILEYDDQDDLIKKTSGAIIDYYYFPKSIKQDDPLSVFLLVPNPSNVNRSFSVYLKKENERIKELESILAFNGNKLNVHDMEISKTVGAKDLDIVGRISDSRGVRDSTVFSLRVFVEEK